MHIALGLLLALHLKARKTRNLKTELIGSPTGADLVDPMILNRQSNHGSQLPLRNMDLRSLIGF